MVTQGQLRMAPPQLRNVTKSEKSHFWQKKIVTMDLMESFPQEISGSSMTQTDRP